MPGEPTSAVIEELQKLNLSVKLEISQLKQQQNILALYKLDLDLLKREFYLNASYVTQAALWHDALSYYSKLILYIEIILASCVIGLISSAAGLIILVFSGITLVLLKQHAETDKLPWTNFCSKISAMESNLHDKIKSFNEIQGKLVQLFEVVQKKNEDLTEILKSLSEKVAFMQQEISSLNAMAAELNQCTEALKIRSSDVQVKNAEFIKCIDNIMKKLIELSQEQAATLPSKDIEEFEDGVDQLSLKARGVRAELEQQKQSHKEEQTEFQNLIAMTPPEEDEASLKHKEERMARINEIGERARTVLNQGSEIQATKVHGIE